ncbi:unnamed protein product [Camellia sinensis]
MDDQMMNESMKARVENVAERGKVGDEYITSQQQRDAFNKWNSQGFTRQDHPTVLLEIGRDKDITGESMPNLIYVSRHKSKTFPHHLQAGALNALLSAIMTNAPIFLILDCDMYSNDHQTPHRMLCFFSDPKLRPNLGYVQFPQIFHGLNKDDIYACEFKRLFQINPVGMDDLLGPSSFLAPEIPELRPEHVVSKPIQAQQVLALAHQVTDCKYENQSNWGSKLGFRYGSLVEDYYTGYRLQCEGWKSVFCHPNRAAFLGDVPITLNDVLSQTKRWCAMGPLMGLCYAHSAFWSIWSIPITIYAFLPQLTLLNGISIFPKVSDNWFFLYIFLFIGNYGQDCLDYILAKGTFQRWWSDQRMWMVRGVTSYMFGLIEFMSKYLGIATQGFHVTSKVIDNEQGKRYDQGTFEFGVESPMFVSPAVAAIINLIAFVGGLIGVLRGKNSRTVWSIVDFGFCGVELLPSL